MSKCPWFALVGLLSVSVTAHTTPRCPGTAASVHARHLAEYLNIVDIFINHAGPYPFLLDTGAQITSVDPALASELHLKPGDAGNLLGVSSHQAIQIAQVDDIRVGNRNLTPSVVAIRSMGQLQSADPSLRGVLGGDFLRHFDVLIDHANALLCLGKAGEMRSHIHGEQLTLQLRMPRAASPSPNRLSFPRTFPEWRVLSCCSWIPGQSVLSMES